jgi:hypothetical protein
MTAAQLAHLAELAALAADYFGVSAPDAARLFGDSALRAEMLSAQVRRDETAARSGTGLPHAPCEHDQNACPKKSLGPYTPY